MPVSIFLPTVPLKSEMLSLGEDQDLPDVHHDETSTQLL